MKTLKVATQGIPRTKKQEFEFDVMYHHMPLYATEQKTFPYNKIIRSVVEEKPAPADTHLANSEYTAEKLPVDTTVVPPYIPEVEEGKNWGDRTRDVVYVGRASKESAETAAQICEDAGVRLTVVGPGDWQPVVENLSKYEIINNPSREHLENVLHDSRVLLCPGVESFGVTPLEAIQAGAVPVAEKGAGQEEVLDDSRVLYEDISEAVGLVRKYVYRPPEKDLTLYLRDRVQQFQGRLEKYFQDYSKGFDEAVVVNPKYRGVGGAPLNGYRIAQVVGREVPTTLYTGSRLPSHRVYGLDFEDVDVCFEYVREPVYSMFLRRVPRFNSLEKAVKHWSFMDGVEGEAV